MDLSRSLGLPLATLALGLGLALPAAPQGRAERHLELGLSLSRPRDYEPLPVRPGDRFRVLAYRRAPESIPAEARAAAASLELFVVSRDAPPGAPVIDVETFLARERADLELREVRAGRGRFGCSARRWEGSAPGGAAVLLYSLEGPERTVILEGRTGPEQLGRERRVFESVLTSLRLHPPRDLEAERAKLERFYGGRRLSGTEHRIEARLRMVAGWRARDTAHYLVVHHDVDEAFLRELCESVEAIRREFRELCPPDRAIGRVSTVRICRDQDEFRAYGGPDGWLGYWSATEEELVLYDARDDAPEGVDGGRFTQAVLFHEAFHQYVHDALERVSPHPWFDEGLAEYFAGAHVVAGRVRGIEPNVYRVGSLQRAVSEGRSWPWEQVLGLDRRSFYADASALYAQAWGMVHFLVESEEVRLHPRWRRILPTYFRALRTTWMRERRRVTKGDQIARAMERARREALEAAFEGVDLEELETAWRSYVSGLPDARPR